MKQDDPIVSYNFDSEEHCVRCTLAIFDGKIPPYVSPKYGGDDSCPAPMTRDTLSEVHRDGLTCGCGQVLVLASEEEEEWECNNVGR